MPRRCCWRCLVCSSAARSVVPSRLAWLTRPPRLPPTASPPPPRALNQGFRGFYKGATARLARVSLDVTVIMVLYEQISKVLDAYWVE